MAPESDHCVLYVDLKVSNIISYDIKGDPIYNYTCPQEQNGKRSVQMDQQIQTQTQHGNTYCDDAERHRSK